ncbi:NAD(P)-dependent oxidoreductase [Aurantiacibacter rhizosphaerae]|uniref:NAD-binding protein n=1 Tax=Aurantiacibacter rhizosphaerae TaxID=2691582 RepID=A0A844X963_9SPHN|nr:NAD(P)-dependent oxidoreductase [Aurantiacibacter rhizosphaerae]MWV26931.1 NAD-binding protein [Aurantiacibacter rhizosphaerae]
MTKVAMIGAGVMGSAIGSRLLDEGCTLSFFDVSQDAGGDLAGRGGSRAASPEQAASEAEFVFVSLNSADIVEQAVFGDGGVAESGRSGSLLIDMSSIDPGRTASMAGKLRERCGMGWVDAPLSGGAPAAREGRMTLMIGGRPEDVARAEPVLALLSARRTHLGDAGAGQTVKLVNQILCAGHFMILAEAVKFAESQGIDAALIPDALAGGRADSAIMQEFMAKMAKRDFTPTGRIDNMLKDLETVQASSFATRTAMPVTGLVSELHRMLVAGGLGPADSAEYMKLFDLGNE